MAVTFSVTSGKPHRLKGDILAVPVWARGKIEASLPDRERPAAATAFKVLDFSGEWGISATIASGRDIAAPFVAGLGLGDAQASRERLVEGMRRACGLVAQEARLRAAHTLVIDLTAMASDRTAALAGAAAEAILLATYQYTRFAPQQARQARKRQLKQVIIAVSPKDKTAVEAALGLAQTVMKGVTYTRELVNQPASTLTPQALVAAARQLAEKQPELTVTVWDRQAAAAHNFNAFLAVAKGSTEEPYVIHLHYRPKAAPRRSIALVGKGITFDSGGLSLKPAEHMEDMKIDMAGAATVLGFFSVLPRLKVPLEFHGVIAACENMPSGAAYRPGDILTAKNGKTIEVLNTDAEGRITLADALSYAVELKPDEIIDLATLTGACMVALGESIAGLWSNNQSLQSNLVAAAASTGEGVAALPLPDEYLPYVQSLVADVRNTSQSKYGGAITAALFLREFVNGIPWAHLDIAGPSYLARPPLSYYLPGATGYGVRLLVEYARRVAQSNKA